MLCTALFVVYCKKAGLGKENKDCSTVLTKKKKIKKKPAVISLQSMVSVFFFSSASQKNDFCKQHTWVVKCITVSSSSPLPYLLRSRRQMTNQGGNMQQEGARSTDEEVCNWYLSDSVVKRRNINSLTLSLQLQENLACFIPS